jgi:hypothetical protein
MCLARRLFIATTPLGQRNSSPRIPRTGVYPTQVRHGLDVVQQLHSQEGERCPKSSSLARFSVDVNRNSQGVPKGAQIRFGLL